MYQETPDLAALWRSMGAEVINMETTTLYASCAHFRIPALYIGHVSDELRPDRWISWSGRDRDEMAERTANYMEELIRSL